MTRLQTHGVDTGYPGRPLVRGLDLCIEAGQVWALLGNNGAGKSTLLLALSGLRPTQAGAIELDGRPLASFTAAARARRIGLLLQEDLSGFWGTLRDYVLLGRYPHRRSLWGWGECDVACAEAAIAEMDLDGRAHRPLAALSGGERQRARLAMLLAQAPALLLLDEPLQHLDLRHQRDVLVRLCRWAGEGDRAVVMSLHDPVAARRFCDHALLLYDDGSWRAGRADSLLDDTTLEGLYGCALGGEDAAAQGRSGRRV